MKPPIGKASGVVTRSVPWFRPAKAALLLSFLCFVSSCCGEKLGAGEIVPAFYRLLIQPLPPTPREEQDFFGGTDCGEVRACLLNRPEYQKSETPVWDYLRAHREVFITKDLQDLAKLRVLTSTPFTFSSFRDGRPRSDLQILAEFPKTQIGKSTFTGEGYVIFSLGQECYLAIGLTRISDHSQLFLERVYNDTR